MMDSMTDSRDVSSVSPSGQDVIEELAASGALDGLFARIDAGEVEMTGTGGLIPGLIKAALERGLAAELTDHLGYAKGAAEAAEHVNSRNGHTPKTVATQVGQVDLAVPRDRDGSFTPRLVPKGSPAPGRPRRHDHQPVCGRDDDPRHRAPSRRHDWHRAVAGNDQQDHRRRPRRGAGLAAAPAGGALPGGLSRRASGEGRDGAHVANKAAHIAVGVDIDGVKHVLGIWIQAAEGSKFWAGVCANLANRGVKDVLIVCCDGLVGLPEAIEATWSKATVQTCVVHLIRASMRFVNYADRKAFAAALKPIYTAADADAARLAFDAFRDSTWGQKYPHAVATWQAA